MSLTRLMGMFPDDVQARAWFERQIWPQGAHGPHCGSLDIQHPTKHRSITHRCRDCRKDFSLKTGTLMEGSKLGYQKRAIAICLAMTGMSLMRLHRDLGITQKSAWHLAHRIRKAIEGGAFPMFAGPAEADETCIGGKRANMSNVKRKALANAGHGAVGRAAVAGV